MSDDNENTSAASTLNATAGSVTISGVRFEVWDGELTIDHTKCHWSDIYTMPLDNVPKLIEYLQNITQNRENTTSE